MLSIAREIFGGEVYDAVLVIPISGILIISAFNMKIVQFCLFISQFVYLNTYRKKLIFLF